MTSATASSNATSQNQQSSQNSTTTNSSEPRLPNTTICVPIVYGSIAFPLKKVEEYHTHRWTLYVRGPNDEDLSAGIAKVVFQLHPSFPQPVRELTAPPFEVTEKGWGEFEATIRIVWRDSSEKATVLTHGIKLYPPIDTTATVGNKEKDDPDRQKQPVLHDFYDEVVFTNPTEPFHKQLMRGSIGSSVPKVKSQEPAVQEHVKRYADEEDFKILLEAQKFLVTELQSVKDRILRADSAKQELEEAIAVATAKSKSASAVSAAASANACSGNGTKRKSKASGGGNSKKTKT